MGGCGGVPEVFASRQLRRQIRYPHEVESLHPILEYRLCSMELATDYKNYLSLTFPDCNSYDFDAWLHDICLNCRQQGLSGQAANKRLRYYRDVQRCIEDSGIFDLALPGQSWTYSKPDNYLAAAMCSLGLSLTQVEKAVGKLQACKCYPFLPLYLISNKCCDQLLTKMMDIVQ